MRVIKDYGKGDNIYAHIKLFVGLDDALKEWHMLVRRDLKDVFYNDPIKNTPLAIENFLKKIMLEHDGELTVDDNYYIYYNPNSFSYIYQDYDDDYESNISLISLPIN